MKAVFVCNMPSSCKDCHITCDGCTPKKYFQLGAGRPPWCPLRPLPEKQKLTVTGKNQIETKRIIKCKSLEQIKKGFINNSEVAFYCGYNACRSEVAGETE